MNSYLNQTVWRTWNAFIFRTETPLPIGRGSRKPDWLPLGGELGYSSINPQVVNEPIRRIRFLIASQQSASSSDSVFSRLSNSSARKTYPSEFSKESSSCWVQLEESCKKQNRETIRSTDSRGLACFSRRILTHCWMQPRDWI